MAGGAFGDWTPQGGSSASATPSGGSALGAWKPPVDTGAPALPALPAPGTKGNAAGAALAGATAGKGGGKGGILGDILNTVNPANIAKGVGQLGKDVVTGIARGGELAGNEALTPFGGGHQDQFHLGGLQTTVPGATTTREGSALQQVGAGIRQYPAIEGARAGLKQTGTHAVGALELPALAANKALGRSNAPLTGAASKLVKDYAAHPFSSAVNDAANVSLLSGVGAGALGGAAEGSTAARLAGGLGKVGETAGKVATLPFAPIKGVISGLDIPRTDIHLPGISDIPFKDHGVVSTIGETMKAAGARAKAGQAVAGMQAETAAPISQYSADNMRLLRQAATDRTTNEFVAGVMHQVEHPGILQGMMEAVKTPGGKAAVEATLKAMGATIGETPSLEALRLAVHPTENVLDVSAKYGDVSANRQGAALAGEGTALGKPALSPLQTQTEQLPYKGWDSSVTKPLEALQRERDLARSQTETFANRATRWEQSAAREVPVKTGQSGIKAAEQQSIVAGSAAERAAAQHNLGNGAMSSIEGNALKDVMQTADPKFHEAQIKQEQAGLKAQHEAQLAEFQTRNQPLFQQANTGLTPENIASGVTPDDATRAINRASASAEIASRLHDAKQGGGLAPVMQHSEIKAEAQARADANIPSAVHQMAAMDAAASNALVHVRDALHTDAEAAAGGLRASRPGFGDGGPIDVGPSRPGYESLSRQEQALYREQVGQDYANRTANELKAAEDKVHQTMIDRGRAAGMEQGIRTGKAQVASGLATQAAGRAMRLTERYSAALDATLKDERTYPADVRRQVGIAKNMVDGLKSEVERSKDPTEIAHLTQVTSDLQKYADPQFYKGQTLTHIQGTNSADYNAMVKNGSPPSGGGPRTGQFRGLKSENFRKGITAAYTPEGVAKLENQFWNPRAANEFVRQLHNTMSSSVADIKGQIPGFDQMNPEERWHAITNLKDAAGNQLYEPWDPSSRFGNSLSPKVETLNDSTRVLPKPVFDTVTNLWQPAKIAGNKVAAAAEIGTRGFDRATQLLYRNVIANSPSYLLKRTIGDAAISVVKGDIPVKELVDHLNEVRKQINEGLSFKQKINPWAERNTAAIPAGLKLGLNDDYTALTGDQGRLDRIAAVMQRPARTIDLMFRTANYLHYMEQNPGADVAQGVRYGNEAMGSLHTLSPIEKNVLARLMPVYPWAKAVGAAAIKLGADHPAAVLWAMHLGELAANNPQFNPGYLAENLNPLGIFSNPTAAGSFLNPIARGAVGAVSGVNPGTLKPYAQPGGKTGSLVPGIGRPFNLHNIQGLGYFAANQLPEGKLALQAPIPKIGLSQDVARYATGEIRTGGKGGQALPAYTPPTKTPLGRFGPYWRQFLGNPANPKPNASGTTALQKIQQKQSKAGAKRSGVIKALNARGVR